MILKNAEVLDYIVKAREADFSDKKIVVALVKAGYAENDVWETLAAPEIPEPVSKPKAENKVSNINGTSTGSMPTDMFGRSLFITKLTWRVIMADKEILAYVIFALFLNIIFAISMLAPIFIGNILDSIFGIGLMGLGMLFLFYVGSSFIATFFNVAIGYTVKSRIEGHDPSVRQGISFSFSRVHLILLWSILSATVGLVLRQIESFGNKVGPIGSIITHILTGLIGLAWTIATLFVIPSIVINATGPFASIKGSVNALKKTWGENLVLWLGFGFAQMLFFLLGIVVFGPLIFLSFYLLSTGTLGIILLITISILALIYLMALILFFQAAKQVYMTALFMYAQDGTIAPQFGEKILKSAFRLKKKSRFGF